MPEVWPLYEAFAPEYDRVRSRDLMERAYLGDVAANLPATAEVLDLGCGCGEPIARFFLERGHRVTGIDAAPAMVALCETRFPDATWIHIDMRGLALGRRFDAIVAWDSFFHLEAGDQRAMFPVFAEHIAPGGTLLFTSGHRAGEAIGTLGDAPLYHASLDPEEYRDLLEANGFQVLRFKVKDPECGGHTVWLAQDVG